MTPLLCATAPRESSSDRFDYVIAAWLLDLVPDLDEGAAEDLPGAAPRWSFDRGNQ